MCVSANTHTPSLWETPHTASALWTAMSQSATRADHSDQTITMTALPHKLFREPAVVALMVPGIPDMHLCSWRQVPSGKSVFLYILQIDMTFPVSQVLPCVLIISAFLKMEDQTESRLFLPHDVRRKQRCLLCAGTYSKRSHVPCWHKTTNVFWHF